MINITGSLITDSFGIALCIIGALLVIAPVLIALVFAASE